MVVIGTDVHKRSHTFVAVDAVGKQIGQLTVPATGKGHDKALRWAVHEFGTDLTWAIEDCRQLSARLERDLLTAGQRVVRVPPKMMAGQRRRARTRGKSDPIDAAAVARAFQSEPDLPVASHDDVSRELKLLVDRRETLIRQRTATINTLRWRLHELDPELELKNLDRGKSHRAAAAFLAGQRGIVAELARDELADVIALTERINTFQTRLERLTAQVAPELLKLPGCGPLSAAKLVGEAAGITRFATEARFARHAGIAPIPVWSGATEGRVRLTRSGNRQLNAAIHRIALTQIRQTTSTGGAYYQKKRDERMTKREALRCLKRHLARTVYQLMLTDHHNRTQPTTTTKTPEIKAAA